MLNVLSFLGYDEASKLLIATGYNRAMFGSPF
jgi:hypothetical protein